MRLDSSLAFVPLGGQSMVGAAGVSIPSVGTVDLGGGGVGTTVVNIIGTPATFGTDIGVGEGFLTPKLNIAVGTAFATANAATLNIALQGAPDAGAGVPGAWQTFVETGPLTAAQLAAGAVIGRFTVAPAQPPNEKARFLRLLFQLPAAANFTAGTIAFAYVVPNRDDLANAFAASGYKVQ